MKAALIMFDNRRQVIFWPETEDERVVLSSFGGPGTLTVKVSDAAICIDGYLKGWDMSEAIMLELVHP